MKDSDRVHIIDKWCDGPVSEGCVTGQGSLDIQNTLAANNNYWTLSGGNYCVRIHITNRHFL